MAIGPLDRYISSKTNHNRARSPAGEKQLIVKKNQTRLPEHLKWNTKALKQETIIYQEAKPGGSFRIFSQNVRGLSMENRARLISILDTVNKLQVYTTC